MIRQFRKKPVIISALRWSGRIDDADEMAAFIGLDPFLVNGQDSSFYIPTLEGGHIASIGDYIIKGVKGEFYPCKPDIFDITYEAFD